MTSWRLPLVKTGVIVWLSLIKTAQLSKKSRLNEILFGIQKFQGPTFLSSFQPFWEFWENLSRGAEPNNFQVASSKRCLWISIFFLRNFGKELKFQREILSSKYQEHVAPPLLQPFLRLILYTVSWKIWNDLGTLCPSLPGTPVRLKLKPPFHFLAGDISFFFFGLV